MTILSEDAERAGTERGPVDPDARALREIPLGASESAWRAAVRGVCGASRPKGITDRDVAAVYGLLEQLRADLDSPATAADEDVLASFARTVLLEWRLSRSVFGKGALRRNGDARPALSELRQVIRLKVDLLGRLRFRNGKPTRKTLDAYLAGRRVSPAAAPQSASRSSDVPEVHLAGERDAAPTARSDAAESVDGGGNA